MLETRNYTILDDSPVLYDRAFSAESLAEDFEIKDGKPSRLTADRAIAIGELEEELASYEKPWVLLGDGAELCYKTLDREKVKVHLAPEPLRIQSARGVGLAAMGREPRPGRELLPVYLRLSQAERERQAKLDQ